ncbi:hypothetical protein ACFLU6_03445 [Acidobacteriota bacterium]
MTRKLIRPTLASLGIQKPRPGRGKKKAKVHGFPLVQGLPISKKPGERLNASVLLKDGEEVKGTIEWYDKGCIKLNRAGAPNLLIMRHSIRYISQVED